MKTLMCSAVLLLLFIANFHRVQAQCGGFQVSCEQFAIGSDGVFSAQCRNEGGALVGASINLDNYISNSNGNLVDGGGFSLSCGNEGWVNEQAPNVAFFIVAQCRRIDGSLVYTSFDISNHVVNSNGGLFWNFCSPHLVEVASQSTVGHTGTAAKEGEKVEGTSNRKFILRGTDQSSKKFSV